MCQTDPSEVNNYTNISKPFKQQKAIIQMRTKKNNLKDLKYEISQSLFEKMRNNCENTRKNYE